ncbi:hypothetical protein BN165_1040041 [Clostridioides difficile E1]|nr:hypothetical protein BN163_1130043 [Clostridioides difficile T5]CCK94172.1 hypothetical protein BN165_1040041 [Clostridioides difficile E1]
MRLPAAVPPVHPAPGAGHTDPEGSASSPAPDRKDIPDTQDAHTGQ